MKVLDAIVDENGDVKVLDPVDLPKGQKLLITVIEDIPPSRNLSDLAGCLPWSGEPVTIEEMRRVIEEGWAGK